MNGPDGAPWVVGDLDDPWVLAVAEALPGSAARLPCAGELPESWPSGIEAAGTVVLHRPYLSGPDYDRLRRLKSAAGAGPRLVLCVGPHVRYRELERWAGLVDVILPEATAPEVVGRHIAGFDRPPRKKDSGPTVTVISGLFELRSALAEACSAAGYRVNARADWPAAARKQGGLVVWDVPVLDESWPEVLAQHSQRDRVVTLIGFADRVSVRLARSQGAAACLDLPCDPDDLVFVLDRLASAAPTRSGEPAHAVPPAPAGLKQAGRKRRRTTGKRS